MYIEMLIYLSFCLNNYNSPFIITQLLEKSRTIEQLSRKTFINFPNSHRLPLTMPELLPLPVPWWMSEPGHCPSEGQVLEAGRTDPAWWRLSGWLFCLFDGRRRRNNVRNALRRQQEPQHGIFADRQWKKRIGERKSRLNRH